MLLVIPQCLVHKKVNMIQFNKKVVTLQLMLYPTSNLYFSKICDVKLAISKWIGESDALIKQMAEKMSAKFDKYWNVIHDIMGVASVLDPRFKMDLVEYYYEKMHGQDSSIAEIQKIKDLCYDLISDYQSQMNQGSNNDSSMLATSGDDALDDFDAYMERKKRAKTSSVKTELDHYLEEDVIPRKSSDFDILMWWKLNGVKYPTLQAIAKDVLAIPVSTVASESSFSTSGIILSPHRSRLHWTTLEALMCARSWLWSVEKTGGSNSKLCDAYATLFDEMECDDEGELASSVITHFEE